MSAAPLSPYYYVDNFVKVLKALQARDRDLLDDCEADFIRGFFSFPLGAQALIVRMALRQGPFYRGRSLQYADLPEYQEHLRTLQSAGWVTSDPLVDFNVLIDVLPSTWLVEGLGLKPRPALCKVRMKSQAREIYPEPLPLSATHFRLPDGLYEFVHAKICARLCAMYFGNGDQDWSEYVIADLGIRRYERIAIVNGSRPFETRAEVETFHALRECERDAATGNADEMLTRLPPMPLNCEWLREWHHAISLKIARRLERQNELPSALKIYRQLECVEAEERQTILRRKLAGERGTRFNHRSVPHFDLALAEYGGSRIEYAVAQRLVAEHPDSEVLYTENRLINSLFGLLLWQVIFAPVRGAYFHEFHAAPVDLHSPQFRARRRREIDASLEELTTGAYVETMRRNFREKARLLNPFVAWGWLRKRTLDLALAEIPAAHLTTLFEWMLSDLKRNTAGFPDLIQFWPGSGCYRMIEVKLGADRLQDNQRRFLQHAHKERLPITVCYVSVTSRPARHLALTRSPRRGGASLELFSEAQRCRPIVEITVERAAGDRSGLGPIVRLRELR